MCIVVIWTVIVSVVAFAHVTAKTRELIVGFAVNINLLFFYGAPFSSIVQVLKERNSESIHIGTMITNSLNGIFWMAYGLAVADPFIIVPNGIGVFLGVVQGVLVLLLPRHVTAENGSAPGTIVVAPKTCTTQAPDTKQETPSTNTDTNSCSKGYPMGNLDDIGHDEEDHIDKV